MLSARLFPGMRQGKAARGFTMIEVLVTLVIMMFGLLGIAGLIVKGQKASSEAYQRNQALLIASDMAEKMKTNRLAVPAGQLNAVTYLTGGSGLVSQPYGQAFVTVPNTCTSGACSNTGNNLVDYDLVTWNNLLVGSQETSGGNNIGGILNARGCIEQAGGVGTPVRISVAWQGNLPTAVPTTSTCGTGLYGADTYRRVVSIDIL
jgi:type IV pilus assembly protein PilV